MIKSRRNFLSAVQAQLCTLRGRSRAARQRRSPTNVNALLDALSSCREMTTGIVWLRLRAMLAESAEADEDDLVDLGSDVLEIAEAVASQLMEVTAELEQDET